MKDDPPSLLNSAAPPALAWTTSRRPPTNTAHGPPPIGGRPETLVHGDVRLRDALFPPRATDKETIDEHDGGGGAADADREAGEDHDDDDGRPLITEAARRVQLEVGRPRRGSVSMIRRRSAGERPPQAAISSRLRRQPAHSLVRGSMR